MPLHPFHTSGIENNHFSVLHLHRPGQSGLLLGLKLYYADSRFEVVNGLAKSLLKYLHDGMSLSLCVK